MAVGLKARVPGRGAYFRTLWWVGRVAARGLTAEKEETTYQTTEACAFMAMGEMVEPPRGRVVPCVVSCSESVPLFIFAFIATDMSGTLICTYCSAPKMKKLHAEQKLKTLSAHHGC